MHVINKGNNKIINILHANEYVNETSDNLLAEVGFGVDT
jgi:hypothetical protein